MDGLSREGPHLMWVAALCLGRRIGFALVAPHYAFQKICLRSELSRRVVDHFVGPCSMTSSCKKTEEKRKGPLLPFLLTTTNGASSGRGTELPFFAGSGSTTPKFQTSVGTTPALQTVDGLLRSVSLTRQTGCTKSHGNAH